MAFAELLARPRPQTSRYPPSLDVRATLQLLTEQPLKWGALASWLSLQPPVAPKRGKECDDWEDLPPIVPVGRASAHELRARKGLAWKLYEQICMHFLATLLPEASYSEKRVTAGVFNSTSGLRHDFGITWHRMAERGWLHAQPWRAAELGVLEGAEPRLDRLKVGDVLHNVSLRIEEGRTRAPMPLREAELLTLLHGNKVGSEDSTMAVHLATIVEHGYVEVLASDGARLGDIDDGAISRDPHADHAEAEAEMDLTDPGDSGLRTPRASSPARAPSPAAGGHHRHDHRHDHRPHSSRPLSPRNVGSTPRAAAPGGPSYSEPRRAGSTTYSHPQNPHDPPPPPPPPLKTRPAGRYLAPTPLGRALCEGLRAADPSLVEPGLRAALEEQLWRISRERAPPGDPHQRDYQQVAMGVVKDELAMFAAKFEGLQRRLPAAFEPLFGSVATGARELEKGENALITKETVTAFWSNGTPREWRARPTPPSTELTEMVGNAPTPYAVATSYSASTPLDSPQKKFVQSLFSPAGSLRPAKIHEAAASLAQGKAAVLDALQDGILTTDGTDVEAMGTVEALKRLRADRSVSPSVYARIAAAAGGGSAPPTPRAARQLERGRATSPRPRAPSPRPSSPRPPPVEVEEEPPTRPELDTFLDGLEAASIEALKLSDAMAFAAGGARAPTPPRRVAEDTWTARAEREKADKEELRQKGKEAETRKLVGAWQDEFKLEARRAAASEARRSTAEQIEASGRPRIMELELRRVLEPLGGLGPNGEMPATPRSQVSTPRGTRAPSPPVTPRGQRASSSPTTPRGGTSAREPMRALPPKLDQR